MSSFVASSGRNRMSTLVSNKIPAMAIVSAIRLQWWLPRALVAHRGYTFQSPYLYHLIRHVLFAKEGIYAVEWAKETLMKDRTLSRRQQQKKVKKLYMIAHLSILIQPVSIVLIGPKSSWIVRVMQKMHPNSTIICICDALELRNCHPPTPIWDMMIVTNGMDVTQYIDNSCVSIIDRPYGNPERENNWLRTVRQSPTTLDLYDLGIVIHREGLSNGYRRIWC